MEVFTKVSLIVMSCMGKVYIVGQMDDLTKEVGCLAK